MDSITFSQAKARCVAAIREGSLEHEAREVKERKNLLAINAIDVEEAISLVQSTRGQQAKSAPHHADHSIQVWVFQPKDWYIKFYFIEKCMFISFHKRDPAPDRT